MTAGIERPIWATATAAAAANSVPRLSRRGADDETPLAGAGSLMLVKPTTKET
jgi:hypothetical protein